MAAQVFGVVVGDDPADDERHVGQARGAHPVQHLGDQRDVAARQDRQADDMRLLVGGGADDLGRGQADAVVV